MLEISAIISIIGTIIYIFVLCSISKTIKRNYKVLDDRIDKYREESSKNLSTTNNFIIEKEEKKSRPKEGDVVSYRAITGYRDKYLSDFARGVPPFSSSHTPMFLEGVCSDDSLRAAAQHQQMIAQAQWKNTQMPIFEEGMGILLKQYDHEYLILKESGELIDACSVKKLPNSYNISIKFERIPTKEEEVEERLSEIEKSTSKVKRKYNKKTK